MAFGLCFVGTFYLGFVLCCGNTSKSTSIYIAYAIYYALRT